MHVVAFAGVSIIAVDQCLLELLYGTVSLPHNVRALAKKVVEVFRYASGVVGSPFVPDFLEGRSRFRRYL
jgi:hypothetical protein